MSDNYTAYTNVSPKKQEYCSLGIPIISKDYSSLLTDWYCSQPPFILTLNGQAVEVIPKRYKSPWSEDVCFSFAFKSKEHTLFIVIEKRLIVSLLRFLPNHIDMEQIADIAPDDLSLVIEFILSPLLDNFEKVVGPQTAIIPIAFPTKYQNSTLLEAVIHIDNSDDLYGLWIDAPEDDVAYWREILNVQRLMQVENDVGESILDNRRIIPLALQYRSIGLSLGQLNELEKGDVVLFDKYLDEETLEICAGGHCVWEVKDDNGAFSIQGTETLQNNTLNTIDCNGRTIMSDANSMGTIEDIPIVVTFEIGRKEITVKELRNLQEGAVVEFPNVTDQKIHIMANGQEVGWGSLVRIGESLGVKINRIFADE